MSKKERLDIHLVQLGFFETREKARRYIMTGNVLVNDKPVDKPGAKIDTSCPIRLRGSLPKYVGRGGLKLEKALRVFHLDLTDKIMMDIGASTGGFTDCALQNGIKKVYAIDVGYGQLAWKLRNHPKVINMERTNIKHVSFTDISDSIDFISIDVSFISLLKVLPIAISFLKSDGNLIALIKPQFEAGKEYVGKGGIVRDPSVHKMVLNKVLSAIQAENMEIKGLTTSPIKGSDGNIEFLVWIQHAFSLPKIDIYQKVCSLLENYQNEVSL